MKPRYDSYCGLYCRTCENLLVSERGEVELAAKECNDQPTEIHCFGCKSEKNASYYVDCDFKKCCVSKNIDFCFECDIFPCSNLLEVKSEKCQHFSILLKILISLQETGLREWSIVQKNR